MDKLKESSKMEINYNQLYNFSMKKKYIMATILCFAIHLEMFAQHTIKREVNQTTQNQVSAAPTGRMPRKTKSSNNTQIGTKADDLLQLGYCYLDGDGVSVDPQKAMNYFKQAAAKGNTEAMCVIGDMYKDGDGVEQNYQQAINWYTKALNNGNIDGACSLGLMYRDGEGVELDNYKAVSYFQQAANKQYGYGQFLLGQMYMHGSGVQQDFLKAQNLYNSAINNGWVIANEGLGQMYLEGAGVKQDYKKAFDYLSITAKCGSFYSVYTIGVLCANGQGCEQDLHYALNCFNWLHSQGYDCSEEISQVKELMNSGLGHVNSSVEVVKHPVTKLENVKIIKVNNVSFSMVLVNAGTFLLGGKASSINGGSKNINAHVVTIPIDYYIGETEVTQGLWKAIMGKNPSKNKGMNLPVENVNWNDCLLFVQKLSELTGQKFRLPTEAEWEYAAKGGHLHNDFIYSGSDNPNEVAWHGDTFYGTTHEVKLKRPNKLGIYDMTGNVEEWCQVSYNEYDNTSQGINVQVMSNVPLQVIRGGSSWSQNVKRNHERDLELEKVKRKNIGLRIVLEI